MIWTYAAANEKNAGLSPAKICGVVVEGRVQSAFLQKYQSVHS